MKVPSLRWWLLAIGLFGCRDEQAGPRPRASSLPPAVATQAQTTDAAPAELTFRSGATWAGGAVEYLGTQVSPKELVPGQPVRLQHYFRANAAPPQGYRFFVHLVDDAGQMVANVDHEPQDGAAPLERWPVGKILMDSHSVVLPPGAGKVRVLLGFWQGNTRLPVDSPSAQDGEQRMLGPVLSAGQPEVPEYLVRRASKAPEIDGDLGDPAWASAQEVILTRSFDGGPAQLRTSVRLLFDDQNLYVAFDCADPDVWGTLMKNDDPIYNEEVVEIFLDANGDGRGYNELQVSPNNVTFDAMFVARRSNLEEAMRWSSGMKTAVKVKGTLNQPEDRDEGWSAELRIPMASLADVPQLPPKAGDRWRFNVYRLEHLGRRAVEGQAFSPLRVGDFHHLPRFGWLTFQ